MILVAVVLAFIAGVATYLFADPTVLQVLSNWSKWLIVFVGPLSAFCIQAALKLTDLCDNKALAARQIETLEGMVRERIQYVWILSGTGAAAVAFGLAASITFQQPLITLILQAMNSGLTIATLVLALRIPIIFDEMRRLRWRAEQQKRDKEERKEALSRLGPREEFKPLNGPTSYN